MGSASAACSVISPVQKHIEFTKLFAHLFSKLAGLSQLVAKACASNTTLEVCCQAVLELPDDLFLAKRKAMANCTLPDKWKPEPQQFLGGKGGCELRPVSAKQAG